MTKAPATVMYSSIVFRKTVRIALMVAILNNLDVRSGNILNAYVQAPTTQKVWTTFRPKFGKVVRKTAAIV